jgi:hypothetical protein
LALLSGVDHMNHDVLGKIENAAPLGLFTQTASPTSNRSRPSGARLVVSIAGWLEIRPSQVALILLGLLASFAAWFAAGRGPLVQSKAAIPLWIIGITLTILGCWKRERRADAVPWSRIEVVYLLLIFILSFAFRAYGAADMPFVLSGDEGSAGLLGWEFVEGHRDNLLSLGWFSFPALYFWLLSIAQTMFGRSIEAIRWVSALGGALTVIALYWTGRGMFGRRTAFWASAWLSTFHVHLFFSRIAYNNIWDGLFFTIAFGAIWLGWEKGWRRSFILGGLAIGFSQFFYTTSRFIPIIILAWLILLFLCKRPAKAQKSGIASMALVSLSVFLPLGLLYITDLESLLFTASRVSMLVPGWTAEAARALGTTPLGLILEQSWITFLGLFIAELQGIYSDPGVPMLFGISAILVVLGAFICIVRIRDPRYSLPLLTLIATFVIGGLSIQAPSSQRMLLLPPILALLVVFPLEEITIWVSNRWKQTSVLISLIMTCVLGVAMLENLRHLVVDYFPGETYGSLNGEVTYEMIELIHEEGQDAAYFFIGGERMNFDSIPSLAYLSPSVTGTDLAYPYSLPDASPNSNMKKIFIILPDEQEALEIIGQKFDHTSTVQRYNRHGTLLFYVLSSE